MSERRCLTRDGATLAYLGFGGEGPRKMHERLPHAPLVELPDSVHDLHVDAPDQWQRVLTAFLNAASTTAPRLSGGLATAPHHGDPAGEG